MFVSNPVRDKVTCDTTFDDPQFRTMCQALYAAGGGRGEAPHLTCQGLLKYLDAEFTLMLKFTKFAAECLFDYSCGNGFLQNLHDAVTLKVNSKISRITASTYYLIEVKPRRKKN